eukprot:5539147-Alexandrium_andersonii.AAC.1
MGARSEQAAATATLFTERAMGARSEQAAATTTLLTGRGSAPAAGGPPASLPVDSTQRISLCSETG